MRFGAHMSTGGGVWKALERGAGIRCDIIQIFVKNNMQWFGKPYGPEDLKKFADSRRAVPLGAVFGHAGYLINLAAAPSDNRQKSIESLAQEIDLAGQLNLPFLVLHPGAHLGDGEDKGIERVIEGLQEVVQRAPKSKVRIALENTAGQGSCLGGKIEHLADIYRGIGAKGRKRLALCLDTAHFFAAGYDIRSRDGWDAAISEVDEKIGAKEIVAFHLNDSKTDLSSRVDRHAGIGQGKIGKEAFRHIVNDPRFQSHPGCLETPKSKDLHEDVENLRVLRALAGQSA